MIAQPKPPSKGKRTDARRAAWSKAHAGDKCAMPWCRMISAETHEPFEGDYRFFVRLCHYHNGTSNDAAHGRNELYIRPILVKVMLDREPDLKPAFREAYKLLALEWKV